MSLLSPPFPRPLLLSTMSYVCNILLASLDQLSRPCPLPNSCGRFACRGSGGQVGRQAALLLCAAEPGTAAPPALWEPQRQSTTWAARKKLNWVPARPSAEQPVLLKCCTCTLVWGQCSWRQKQEDCVKIQRGILQIVYSFQVNCSAILCAFLLNLLIIALLCVSQGRIRLCK